MTKIALKPPKGGKPAAKLAFVGSPPALELRKPCKRGTRLPLRAESLLPQRIRRLQRIRRAAGAGAGGKKDEACGEERLHP